MSFKNRLVATVSAVASSGLGTFTVGAAVSPYVSFVAADDAKVFNIIAIEGTTWEVRTGCTYTHSGTTLTRGTLESSSTGSAITFTSAVVISVIPTAQWLTNVENAVLLGAEIAVTGAVTATVGRMHVCTGTSADYTVTLPAAANCTDMLIGFRMGSASGLTKFVTLDGNASETIDGATTRLMWAEESAILRCNGSNWFKIAGKSRSMICALSKTSNQSLATQTVVDITLEQTDVDNTGAMADLANDRINIRRAAKYLLLGHIMWAGTSAGNVRMIGQITNSNTATAITGHEMSAYTSGVNASCQPYAIVDLLTTSTIKIQGYSDSAGNSIYGASGSDTTQISATELPSW